MRRTAPERVGEAGAGDSRAIGAWYLFDWAAQPFFTLVVTFLYGPYFASSLAANPVEGQALWGYAGAAAGIVVAVSAPVLGSFADRSRNKKAWIAGFSILFLAGSLALGLARPGMQEVVLLTLAAYVVASVGIELATVFTNAMMPDLSGPERMGRLSGNGAAIGYFGGLLSLIAVIALLQADPATGLTRLGVPPLFGLVSAEASTAAIGPFAAIWYVLFAWPLFVFIREGPVRHGARDRTLGAGLSDLLATIRAVAAAPRLVRFLAASMLYRDGLTALATFGGIYAAGVLGWTQIELGLFGIIIIIAATLSAWLGGKLDDRTGPDRVVRAALLGLIVTTVLLVSIGPDRLLFVVPVSPLEEGGVFASTADVAMLTVATLIGLFFGPVHASSRSLLVTLALPDRMTALFGLYALAGRMVSFLGPLLVAVTTDLFDNQRAGAAVIPFFFLGGMLLLPRLSR